MAIARSVGEMSARKVTRPPLTRGRWRDLRLIKNAERHGGDPRLWLQLWMRSKHIEASDRTYHEMKVLADALFYAGTFDQIVDEHGGGLGKCEDFCWARDT